MKRRLLILVSGAFALLALALPGATLAQTATPGPTDVNVRCDSTLISLLVAAINDYDYKSPIPMTTFDFGQYTQLVADAADMDVTELEPKATPTSSVAASVSNGVNQAATQVTQGGLPSVGSALSSLSNAAGQVAQAGQQALQAGQQAISAGAAAISNSGSSGPLLEPGALPGEDALCTALRSDLLTFMYQQLTKDISS